MIRRSEIDAYHRLTKLHEEALDLVEDLANARAELALRLRRNAADAVDLVIVLDLMMEDARALVAPHRTAAKAEALAEFESIVASLRIVARDQLDGR